MNDDKFNSVAEAARAILAAHGRHETSDSARVLYTAGDLNIASEGGALEIIFRGTLVLRDAPGGGASGRVFEEHGAWREEVERLAEALPGPRPADNAAERTGVKEEGTGQ